jgi:peptide chain release factor 1
VSVAVLDPQKQVEIALLESDLDIRFFSGTGAGGQHRNRKQCSVMMTHIPTGVSVKVEGRSRESNIEEARKTLVQRIMERESNKYQEKYSSVRRDQIGETFRGNKRRTYNEKANEVVDHITGKSTTFRDILKGNIKSLHE